MKKAAYFFVLMIAVVLFSCSYKKEAIAYPATSTNFCDTFNIRYSVEITNIVNANCLSCHANAVANSIGGGRRLEGYSNLQPYAAGGLLLGVVAHSPGYNPMPKSGGKISDCDIAKIRTWIRNGIPNN